MAFGGRIRQVTLFYLDMLSAGIASPHAERIDMDAICLAAVTFVAFVVSNRADLRRVAAR